MEHQLAEGAAAAEAAAEAASAALDALAPQERCVQVKTCKSLRFALYVLWRRAPAAQAPPNALQGQRGLSYALRPAQKAKGHGLPMLQHSAVAPGVSFPGCLCKRYLHQPSVTLWARLHVLENVTPVHRISQVLPNLPPPCRLCSQAQLHQTAVRWEDAARAGQPESKQVLQQALA